MNHTERLRALLSIQGQAGSIEAHMPALLRAMAASSTVRAAALSPGGGGLGDPTGEEVADALSGKAKEHLDYIDEQIDIALAALADAAATVYRYVPERTPIRQSESRCPEGWCTSCWRIDKAHSPADRRYGNKLCSWCGGIRAEYGKLPPFSRRKADEGRTVFSGPLAKHVEGRRVTKQEIEEAFKPRPPVPKSKRRKRKGRAA